MSLPNLDLRFGIEVNGQRSYTWHVRSGANKPELFVDRENLPPKVHLSLHESGNWHMKVGRRAVHEWRRPAELVPGYTHALAIVQPVAVALFALPAPADAHILPLPADAEPTQFDLWIERPGANLQSWPGKNGKGTRLVGRMPLAGDAGTCCAVSRQAPMRPVEFTSAGRLYHTLIGGLPDGTFVLLDGRFDPTNVGGSGLSTLAFNWPEGVGGYLPRPGQPAARPDPRRPQVPHRPHRQGCRQVIPKGRGAALTGRSGPGGGRNGIA